MNLTQRQENAYDEICSRLEDGQKYVSLTGFAGTGKSFMVAYLVSELTDRRILLTAPTHKAVWVLYDMCRRRGLRKHVEVRTLHSALGLRLRPNGRGGYHLESSDRQRLPDGGLILVDEASMIGQSMWDHITGVADDVQWLFVGDPAQLPPVGEGPSPALEQDGPSLTEIVRQAAENPIIQFATSIREGDLALTDELVTYRNGEGIGVTHSVDRFIDSAAACFDSDAFRRDPTSCRILAYRNRRVRYYNRMIRSHLYGEEADAFREGEWIVARVSWEGPGPGITIQNSEELKIRQANPSTIDGPGGRWDAWTIKARPARGRADKTLAVLREEEKQRFEDELGRRKEMAVNGAGSWEDFYELKEFFAEVDYAYAMTVHKAQGSTFDVGYVDWRDVNNGSGDERTALQYVAATRPSKRLALLVPEERRRWPHAG